jgi:hypothetical protein
MGINLPQFVSLDNEGSTLRLIKGTNCYEYYVDGGCWSVNFMVVDGKIISKSHINQLNNKELIPITENEWRNKQGEYAPKNPPIYGFIVGKIELPTQDSVKNLKYLLIKR